VKVLYQNEEIQASYLVFPCGEKKQSLLQRKTGEITGKNIRLTDWKSKKRSSYTSVCCLESKRASLSITLSKGESREEGRKEEKKESRRGAGELEYKRGCETFRSMKIKRYARRRKITPDEITASHFRGSPKKQKGKER